jgi:hypothetical protein
MMAASVLATTSVFACWEGKSKTGLEAKKLPDGGGVGLTSVGALPKKRAKRTRRSGPSRARTVAPTHRNGKSSFGGTVFFLYLSCACLLKKICTTFYFLFFFFFY